VPKILILTSKTGISAVLIYAGISAVCLAARSTPLVESFVRWGWDWLWALGPPVTLIHGSGLLYVYSASSALLVVLTVIGRLSWSQHPGVTLLCGGIAILVWCASGFLVYAPVA